MSCLVVDTKFALEKDLNGDSPLYLAVPNGHEGVVRILLDTWGGTECPADDPRPAALWLARVHERHDIAKLLISRGAAIDLQNGTRPQVLIQAAKEGNLQLVRRCLEVGVAINVAGPPGETALDWAVDNRDEEMTKLHISNGVVAHHASLLVAAAKWGHAGLFGVLLEKTHEPRGFTLRSILLDPESQHEDILQLVVRKLLEVDEEYSRTSWGRELVDAARAGCEAAVRVLLDNGAGNQDALIAAARCGHVEILRLLLEQGAEIDDGDDHWNLLHCAALHEHPEAVRLLLDRGVKIDAVDGRGRSALHYAATTGHPETVGLLLERGAGVDVVGDGGRTALHCAATSRCPDIVRLLLERGAEIDAVDERGRSALHYAAQYGSRKNLSVLRLLLEQGANREARNKKGRTPLQVLAWWNNDFRPLLE